MTQNCILRMKYPNLNGCKYTPNLFKFKCLEQLRKELTHYKEDAATFASYRAMYSDYFYVRHLRN